MKSILGLVFIFTIANSEVPLHPKFHTASLLKDAEATRHGCYNNTCNPKVDVQMLEMYRQLKFDNPHGGVWTQGFDITYDDRQWNQNNKLKVFVMPHSHTDPGALDTFETLYEDITKNILNYLINALSKDSRRKFIWSDMSFIELWWEDLPQSTRDLVKNLTDNGQLEFVTGGYAMPDEASTHWISQLTQLTFGHQWLQKHLNYTPKSGWAIDVFGHSPTLPLLLQKSGLENAVLHRVHYAVKKRLAQDRHLEFRWRQLWDNDGSTELLTQILPFSNINIPHSCGPDPDVCCQFDFFQKVYQKSCCKAPLTFITKENVRERANLLLDQYRKKAQLFKTNAVLAPLGDDFRFVYEEEYEAQYTNYQKLFDYMNNDPSMNVEIQFGTLSDYFEAVRSEKNIQEFPTLSGDFLTYADMDDHYWCGVFTTRPFYKRFERVLLGTLRAAELMNTIAWMNGNEELMKNNTINRIDVARRWLSIFQHHDGITGTGKDHVVIDFARKLMVALNNSEHILQQAVTHVARSSRKTLVDSETLYLSMDEYRSNETSPGDKYVVNFEGKAASKKVVFYNSIPRSRSKVMSIHVASPYVKVTDEKNQPITCQVSPVWDREMTISKDKYELSFEVTVSALGLNTYFIHSLDNTKLPPEVHFANVKVYNTRNPIPAVPGFDNIPVSPSPQEFTIGDQTNPSAVFDNEGLLTAVRQDGNMYPVRLEFVKYGTWTSGAYVFLPYNQEPDPIPVGNSKIVHVEGPLLSQVSTYLPYVKHIVTHYNSSGSDSFGLHITNEIDITETYNFELVMRINTDINSKDIFYTDSNGLNIIKRQRFDKLPVQGNYYPLAAAGYIEDENTRMTIVTGQPLGVTSMSSGQYEIMQDRRLNQDDHHGIDQGVTDNLLTYHKFTLVMEKRRNSCDYPPSDSPTGQLSLVGQLAVDDLLHPMTGLHPRPDTTFNFNPTFSPLTGDLPVDLEIPSLRVITMPGSTTKGVSLVLHRHALDLCWGESSIQERYPVSQTGNFNLSQLLHLGQDWAISDSPLTFTSIGNSRNSPIVSLSPHQLLSLLLHRK